MLPKVTKQIGPTHCGLASIANCTSYTENELHGKLNFKPLPNGLTIDELKEFMESLETVESLRKLTTEELKTPEELKKLVSTIILTNYQTNALERWHIIANFHMKTVYPEESEYGHFSPVVSADDTACCIEDVWPAVPDRTWLTYENLFAAVNTVDPDSERLRGLLVFKTKI